MDSQDRPSIVVATHGHCFDGMCSAALFTRLAKLRIAEGASLQVSRLWIRARAGGRESGHLRGPRERDLGFSLRQERQAHLVFRPSRHRVRLRPKSAPISSGTAASTNSTTPHYGSCTKLIYDVSRERFGLEDSPDIVELVRWADIIDAARFPNAEMAVLRADPAMWLMTVVENYGDDGFLSRIVPRLLTEPLEEIARSPEIMTKWLPLRDAHLAFVDKVKAKSQEMGRVVYVDLTNEVIDVVGKFVTYALFPKSVYSVMVSRGRIALQDLGGVQPLERLRAPSTTSPGSASVTAAAATQSSAPSRSPNDFERAKQIGLEITAELNR